MSTTREAVYECTFASASELRTAHVRAWDLREAVELFAEELRGDGVAEQGRIRVRAPGAADVSESAFAPC